MKASPVKYPEHWKGDFIKELEMKLKIKKITDIQNVTVIKQFSHLNP